MRVAASQGSCRYGARTLALVLLLCVAGAALGRLTATSPPAPPPAASDPWPLPAVITREVDGARTEQGAVAAALDILGLYGSPAMYDTVRRRELVARTAGAAVQDDLQAQFDTAFALAARGLGIDRDGNPVEGTLVARAIPAGQRVVSYSPDRAVVAVWTTGLLGVAGAASRNPVQERWSTETVTLAWQDGAWRWLGLEHEDGPAPVGSPQVPATFNQVAAAHRTFEEVPRG